MAGTSTVGSYTLPSAERVRKQATMGILGALLLLAATTTAPTTIEALVVSQNAQSLRRTSRWSAAVLVQQRANRRRTIHSSSSRSNLPSQQRQSAHLFMHMGHSHSHHHHHHHDNHDDHTAVALPSNSPQQQQRQQKIRLYRRIGMFLFCALAILGPPYWKHRALTEADVAAFSATVALLLAVDPVRRQIKLVLRKLRDWSRGISRHASSPWSFLQSNTAADRVTLLGGAMNLLLSAGKFAVGVACHSSALIADAGHSLSDLFSDFVTLWAVQVGRLPPDDDHPYGHGKFEAVGSLFLSLTLLATGLGVGAMSNRKLLDILALQRRGLLSASSAAAAAAVPGLAALAMAGLSIVSKEWLFRITRAVGERINSQVVIANAWHHRSDAYSSILALGSIGLARYVPGLIFADAAAGIFVAAMIVMTGAEIMGESIKQLTDSSNDELAKKVTEVASKNDDVASVVRVRARQVGSSATVDLSVAMPDDRPAFAARAVEEQLKQQILRETENVVDIDVRATTATSNVICPLLEAKVQGAANNQTAIMPTPEEVEGCVRDEIMARHPEVNSVERVRVHYQDTLLVDVDVDILVDPSSSILQAGSVAEGLRNTLERSSQINKASIYLDLNADIAANVGKKNQLAS